jgi:hypothetical protein
MRLFVLDEVRKPVMVGTFEEWGAWLKENKGNMMVASSKLEDGTIILTAFLGHSTMFSDDFNNPYTFHTKVVGGQFHDREMFYTSWESAEKGHHEMVSKLTEEIDPDWPEELDTYEDEICTKCGKVIDGSVFVCGSTHVLCKPCMITQLKLL